MRFAPWPQRKFQISTPLNPNEVIDRIASEVETRNLLFPWSGSKYFAGQISGNSFQLRRIIMYRNSFLPQIEGRVVTHGSGSIVEISMKLHWFVAAFVALWFGGVLLALIAILINAAVHGVGSVSVALLPFAMLCFAAALTHGGFWFEANIQETHLNRLLRDWPLRKYGEPHLFPPKTSIEKGQGTGP